MEMKEVSLGAKYFKYSECKKGDVLVENGRYVETYEGKFGDNHKFKEESGETVVLNHAGQLDRLIAENLEVGDACKIVFDGKEVMERGSFAGKEANRFKMFIASNELKEATDAPPSAKESDVDLDDLE